MRFYDRRSSWERNRRANETLLQFMGELCGRYSKTPYKQLWCALEDMVGRYGVVQVTEMISHHKIEAEMALMRYGRSRRCGNISSM